MRIGKNNFLNILEKTLTIQNSGGEYFIRPTKKSASKNSNSASNSHKILKTAGGVFFSLVKKECGLTKEEIKYIFLFQQSRKINKQSNGLAKELEKLLI